MLGEFLESFLTEQNALRAVLLFVLCAVIGYSVWIDRKSKKEIMKYRKKRRKLERDLLRKQKGEQSQ